MKPETKQPESGPKVAEEIRRMHAEPLLPVEKRLIVWSLVLGIALLGILVWVSAKFFPGH